MRRVTVFITEAAYARACIEAAESWMTVAQWIAWLAETYEPPQEGEHDGD